jgi:hypothetical protein
LSKERIAILSVFAHISLVSFISWQ